MQLCIAFQWRVRMSWFLAVFHGRPGHNKPCQVDLGSTYEEGFTDWDSSIYASVGRPSISRYPSESSSAKCYN